MTALSNSDHAVVLLSMTNQHKQWMKDWGFDISTETHQRAANHLHVAMNYQQHNPLY